MEPDENKHDELSPIDLLKHGAFYQVHLKVLVKPKKKTT